MENLVHRALSAGKRLSALWLAALCVAGCGHAGNGVPYKEAERYFLRNDADRRTVPAKIATREEFVRCFGMAAVMGGQPTPVDFDRQFVIAIVLPETNRTATIHPRTLADGGGTLRLEYGVSVAPEENSWTSVPLSLLVVDKRYERERVVLVRKD